MIERIRRWFTTNSSTDSPQLDTDEPVHDKYWFENEDKVYDDMFSGTQYDGAEPEGDGRLQSNTDYTLPSWWGSLERMVEDGIITEEEMWERRATWYEKQRVKRVAATQTRPDKDGSERHDSDVELSEILPSLEELEQRDDTLTLEEALNEAADEHRFKLGGD